MSTKLNSTNIVLNNSILTIDNVPHGTKFKIFANNELQVTIDANIPQLAKPTITQNNTVLSWNAIENANAYIVKYNTITIATITNTSYDMKKYDTAPLENANITIIAIDTAGYYNNSAASSFLYTSPKLGTPNVVLTNNTITWNKITNATSYVISENSTILATVYTTSYDLSSLESGTHSITVTALASGFFDSNESNIITYKGPYLYDVIDSSIKLYKAPYQLKEGGIQIL